MEKHKQREDSEIRYAARRAYQIATEQRWQWLEMMAQEHNRNDVQALSLGMRMASVWGIVKDQLERVAFGLRMADVRTARDEQAIELVFHLVTAELASIAQRRLYAVRTAS